MNEIHTAELILNEMEFYSYHGWYKEEQLTGSKYLVSVKFSWPINIDEPIDHLGELINYEEVYKSAEAIMKEKIRLIEEVCRRIMIQIKNLNSRTQKAALEVTVTKCHPSIGNTKSSSFTLRG
jgi:dihydroneopterin aldolase